MPTNVRLELGSMPEAGSLHHEVPKNRAKILSDDYADTISFISKDMDLARNSDVHVSATTYF